MIFLNCFWNSPLVKSRVPFRRVDKRSASTKIKRLFLVDALRLSTLLYATIGLSLKLNA
jgi:uncharacterized protein (DUF2132 family)